MPLIPPDTLALTQTPDTLPYPPPQLAVRTQERAIHARGGRCHSLAQHSHGAICVASFGGTSFGPCGSTGAPEAPSAVHRRAVAAALAVREGLAAIDVEVDLVVV